MEPQVIKIAHFRYTPSGRLTQQKHDVERRGGYTVVHVMYENDVFVGVARCRKDHNGVLGDVFSKKQGVIIATARAVGAMEDQNDPRIPPTIKNYTQGMVV